ncbi:MAG: ECF-type sigma factor [Bifidobacteriaceae bacterium]|jgi:DNA-binding transcriptional regulator LsrR (DeoR family)|nr:ECF-type sigma factor [Bifidobacteriaceae bacterium]MCI1978550.1 ECF-type sigma factor [Bifidobacteriaceae bacterium]
MVTQMQNPQSHSLRVQKTSGKRTTRERIADAAELYWVQGLKIESVAHQLGVSRSTVSRLLALARERNVIEFNVHREKDSAGELQERLRRKYGISVVVTETSGVTDIQSRRLEVGRDAATWLGTLVKPSMKIGVTWGRTIEAVSLQLTRQQHSDITIMQLHGFGDSMLYGENYVTQILSRFGAAFDAPVYLFPVPAIFSSERTKQMMFKEPSIQHLLQMRKTLDLIITSMGTPAGNQPSLLFSSQAISARDRQLLKEDHVIGNLASVFFREDGSTSDVAVNRRTTGMPISELLKVPLRLFVVADVEKAQALKVALNAGYVTHLVIDQETAKQVLRE